jgi:hypothetical protein
MYVCMYNVTAQLHINRFMWEKKDYPGQSQRRVIMCVLCHIRECTKLIC